MNPRVEIDPNATFKITYDQNEYLLTAARLRNVMRNPHLLRNKRETRARSSIGITYDSHRRAMVTQRHSHWLFKKRMLDCYHNVRTFFISLSLIMVSWEGWKAGSERRRLHFQRFKSDFRIWYKAFGSMGNSSITSFCGMLCSFSRI